MELHSFPSLVSVLSLLILSAILFIFVFPQAATWLPDIENTVAVS